MVCATLLFQYVLGNLKFSLCKDFMKRRIPITSWLPKYTISLFFQDLLAGLTVGMTEIPQGIAYAIVAGLSPEYGLYSGLIDGFIYAIFGSCKDLNIGPTSIVSLLLQPHVTKLGSDGAVLMTFLSGIIIFILGLMHLGFVVRFFSYPIVSGFICAGSLQIASSQVLNLLGIPGKSETFLVSWQTVFTNLEQIQKWDALLGITSFLILIALKEIGKFGTLQKRSDWSPRKNLIGRFIFMVSLSRNALIVVIGTLIAYCLSENTPFKITGDVTGGFPPFRPPAFNTHFNGINFTFLDIIEVYGPSLAFIPIISILEAISIAKAFSKGRTLDATQEMLALGICNMIGSFVSSMPVTGSFTRSAVNHASGVRTTLAGVFTSSLLLLAIAFLTPTFYYVPKATLAAVIISAMFYLFDLEAIILLWKTKKLDLIPFITTFFCSLFISIEYGILIGVGVNLLFILYPSARPTIDIKNDNNNFIITPKDTLYFPSAEYLRDTVLNCEGDDVTIIINGRYIRHIDVTVARSMSILAHELMLKQQKLIFTDFKPSIKKICVGVDKTLRNYFSIKEDTNNTCDQIFTETVL